ncbi:MAG: hypothetical protein Hens3KO_03270 [Henriciella sp.]
MGTYKQANISNQEKRASIKSLISLWFAAEEAQLSYSEDLDEGIQLEKARDRLTDQQSAVARKILLAPATKLEHIFSKLEMWKSAYGPRIDDTLETGWDIYTLMVVSAMDDLERFISNTQSQSRLGH